jgi:hypothetical protein
MSENSKKQTGSIEGPDIEEESMTIEPRSPSDHWFQSRTGLALIAFLAIATFFLVTEHTAHLFGVLPYLLLFLCPLLHLFLHRKHGGKPNNHGEHR